MKFLIFILIVFSASITSAQNKSNMVGDICIPYPVMKNIQTDLLICDSIKDMLFFAEEEIYLLKEKIEYKDSMILDFKLKEINLNSLITNEKEQKIEMGFLYTNCNKEYDLLAKKEKKTKVISKLKSTFGIPIIIILGILYILK
jgi:hypothetical protein